MSKFCGMIGFFIETETRPGIWEQQITERKYIGEMKSIRSRVHGSAVNDDISVSNELSILADPFARENFAHIKYVTFMNAKWKVTSIEIEYPRLVVTVGGLYNEDTT